MSGFLPFARPTIDEAMISAVCDTMRSFQLSSGPQVLAFENALSEYHGGRPARVLTSATAGLELARYRIVGKAVWATLR